MFRQTISKDNLASFCRREDFKNKGIKTVAELTEEFSTVAWNCYQSNFGVYPFRKVLLKNKPHFIPAYPSHALLLRQISHNIRLAFPLESVGRNQIIKNLAYLLSEGVPYNVHRFDVKSFYESFEIKSVKEKISENRKFAPDSLKLCKAILDHQTAFAETGLPRGTHLSAQLSEIMMAEFDLLMRTETSIYYYARFVDDMVFITAPEWTPTRMREFIQNKLPDGLELNKTKTRSLMLAESIKASTNTVVVEKLDFLGYRFDIFNSDAKKGERLVKCAMSRSKVAKIKTRIYRALFDYARRPDHDLLVDRVKFLTSNFKIRNGNSGKTNIAGVYFNYPLLEKEDPVLGELDSFLHRAVLTAGTNAGPPALIKIPNRSRKAALQYSFKRGHNEKLYAHFSGNRLSLIGKCWKY